MSVEVVSYVIPGMDVVGRATSSFKFFVVGLTLRSHLSSGLNLNDIAQFKHAYGDQGKPDDDLVTKITLTFAV